MTALDITDVTVISQHIQIGDRHFVVERGVASAVAYEANDKGHVEIRIPLVGVQMPSLNLVTDALLAELDRRAGR
jgi:hypothetical protein